MSADDPTAPDATAAAFVRLERDVAELKFAVVEMTKAVHRANSLLVPIINETSTLLQIHRATELAVERLALDGKLRTEHLVRLLEHAGRTLTLLDQRLGQLPRSG